MDHNLPIFIKRADGSPPMTDDEYRKMGEYLDEQANMKTPFAILLKAFRLSRGIGARDFAQRIKMLPSSYVELETGRTAPSMQQTLRIIKELVRDA